MRCLAMECLFSYHFLQKIWQHTPTELLIVPAPAGRSSWLQQPRPNQIISSPSVAELASTYGIPIFYMARWNDVLPHISKGEPLVTACFPRIVPQRLLEHASFFNIHPAMLPELRGPDPLFYVARGDVSAGISIHQMDLQFDTGPIIMQQSVDITNCASEAEMIRTHAITAAVCWLGLQTVSGVGRVQPRGGSYAPIPQIIDFTLDPLWSTQRTRRFIQLTNLRRQAYWVPAVQRWVSALHPFGDIEIPCHDGYLRALSIGSQVKE